MPQRLDHLDPNPFRRMDRYPIQRDKVEALKRSIEKTGFWDNIVARPATGRPGRFEVAYGHHRLVALRELFPPDHAVELIVRSLDDASMLRIMAQENMAEWDSNALIDQETVQAVVEAAAAGAIELPDVSEKTNNKALRYAPSFLRADDPINRSDHPGAYTANTVAEFLGWPQPKVRFTLGALELIEQKVLTTRDFLDLNPYQARLLVQQARAIQAEEGRPPKPRPVETSKPEMAPSSTPEAMEVEASEEGASATGGPAAPDGPPTAPQPLAERIAQLLDPDLAREIRALAGHPVPQARAVAAALRALAAELGELASLLEDSEGEPARRPAPEEPPGRASSDRSPRPGPRAPGEGPRGPGRGGRGGPRRS